MIIVLGVNIAGKLTVVITTGENMTLDEEWMENWIKAVFSINKAEYFMLGMLNNKSNKRNYEKCKKEWKKNVKEALVYMKKL